MSGDVECVLCRGACETYGGPFLDGSECMCTECGASLLAASMNDGSWIGVPFDDDEDGVEVLKADEPRNRSSGDPDGS